MIIIRQENVREKPSGTVPELAPSRTQDFAQGTYKVRVSAGSGIPAHLPELDIQNVGTQDGFVRT